MLIRGRLKLFFDLWKCNHPNKNQFKGDFHSSNHNFETCEDLWKSYFFKCWNVDTIHAAAMHLNYGSSSSFFCKTSQTTSTAKECKTGVLLVQTCDTKETWNLPMRLEYTNCIHNSFFSMRLGVSSTWWLSFFLSMLLYGTFLHIQCTRVSAIVTLLLFSTLYDTQSSSKTQQYI